MAVAYTKIGEILGEGDPETAYCAVVSPPVREADFAEEITGKVVRCVLEARAKKFTKADLCVVSQFLQRDSSIVLAVGEPRSKTQFDDLAFLQYFPTHRAFWFGLHHLSSVEPLEELAPQLISLSIRTPRAKTFHWDFLSDCSQLRFFDFFYLPQLFPILPALRRLQHLAFDHTSAAKVLIELPKSLTGLQITLGSLPDLSFLLGASKLKRLELWKCRLNGDLSAISQLKQLRHLALRNLKARVFPSFQSLTQLNSLQLHGLPDLDDLSGLIALRSLKKLSLQDLPALTPEGLGDMQFYQKIKDLRVGPGSGRAARQFAENILSSCPNAVREHGNRSLSGNLATLSYVSVST